MRFGVDGQLHLTLIPDAPLASHARQSQHIAMRFLLITLFVLSAMSVGKTLGQMPAFNPALRAETVLGGDRTVLATAMYDIGSYQYQRGYGFLNADLLVTTATGELLGIATEEEAASQADKARNALTQAVRHDPGNTHAWVALAWAEARMGNIQDAVSALRTSWQNGPYNRAIAEGRLNLLDVLVDPEFVQVDLTEEDLASIAKDLAVLQKYDPRSAQYFLNASPLLNTLQK